MSTFFPYKQCTTPHYQRVNNHSSITLASSKNDVGLPYGVIPRILMMWIVTQAIRNQSDEIYLPSSLSKFLLELGLRRTGGVKGDITRLKEQFIRIIHTSVSIKLNKENSYQVSNCFLIEKANLWWDKDITNFEASIKLSPAFFNAIKNNSIPINLSYVRELTGSCLALDIYSWLCFRLGYLNDKIFIPWESLKAQFGPFYNDDAKGFFNFKKEFSKQLKKVLELYNTAKIYHCEKGKGLYLYPSPTSIGRKYLNLAFYNDKKVTEESSSYEKSIKKVYIEEIENLGFSYNQIEKLITGKTEENINNAIKCVKDSLKKGYAKNPKALFNKALTQGWLPNQDNKETLTLFDSYEKRKLIKHKKININKDWENILNQIRVFMEKGIFESWIKVLNFEKTENNVIFLNCNLEIIKQRVENLYIKDILHACKIFFPEIKAINIEVIKNS
jgi:hypothetical protein